MLMLMLLLYCCRETVSIDLFSFTLMVTLRYAASGEFTNQLPLWYKY